MTTLQTQLVKSLQATNNNNNDKSMKTVQTKKTLFTPYIKKMHPAIQASQAKLNAILQGNNLTKNQTKINQCMHYKQKQKRWQQLTNKQQIPQCNHYTQN